MLVKLSKPVSFLALNGLQVNIPEGAEVYLDLETMVASVMTYHFDLKRDEYICFH